MSERIGCGRLTRQLRLPVSAALREMATKAVEYKASEAI
jgi:hypothetical protein